MRVYYTRTILLCLLVEDVDIVVSFSLLLIYSQRVVDSLCRDGTGARARIM